MERMTKGEGMTPEKYIAMVEEENKKLRDYADNLDSENDNQAIEIEELKKENKKLKEEAVEDIREIALLEIENKKLKKDLAMYEKLREQLFGGLEPEDLYED